MKKVKIENPIISFDGRYYRVVDKAFTLEQWREYIAELIQLFGEKATLDLDSGNHMNVRLYVEPAP